MKNIAYLDVPRTSQPEPILGQEQPSKGIRNKEFDDLAKKIEDLGYKVEYGPLFAGFPGLRKDKDLTFSDGYRFVIEFGGLENAPGKRVLDLAPEGSHLYAGGLKTLEDDVASSD